MSLNILTAVRYGLITFSVDFVSYQSYMNQRGRRREGEAMRTFWLDLFADWHPVLCVKGPASAKLELITTGATKHLRDRQLLLLTCLLTAGCLSKAPRVRRSSTLTPVHERKWTECGFSSNKCNKVTWSNKPSNLNNPELGLHQASVSSLHWLIRMETVWRLSGKANLGVWDWNALFLLQCYTLSL